MSNSSLVEYRNITKKYSRRTGKISKITIHHSASVHSGKQIADFFATSRAISLYPCRRSIVHGLPVTGRMTMWL